MKLDTKATIEGITEVLEHYKTLKKIAGDNYVSKITATFLFEPRSYTGTVRNPIEDHIVRQETARSYMDKIEQAINKIRDPYYRQVLIEKYVKSNVSDIAIYMDLDYSSTEFYRLLDKAKIEFAHYYDGGSFLKYEKGKNVKDLFDFLGEL